MSDLAERIREIVKAYSEPAVRSFEAVATDCCHVLIHNAPTILAALELYEKHQQAEESLRATMNAYAKVMKS